MAVNRRLASALLLGLIIGSSCSGAQEATPAGTPEDTRAAAFEESSTSKACSAVGARELVESFLSAYSTGSSGASLADRFFAPDDRFQWFHDALTRPGEEAGDRSGLDAYFAQQQASGDTLQLVSFSYSGHRAADNTGHFGMVLARDELVVPGKGAIDCGSGKIMVWALGPP